MVIGEPNIYHDSGVFYKEVGILLGGCLTYEELVGVTWRVPDWEELVGGSQSHN